MPNWNYDNIKGVSTITITILILFFVICAVIIGMNIAKTQISFISNECNSSQFPYTISECDNVIQIPYSTNECDDILIPNYTQECTPKDYACKIFTTTCSQYNQSILPPNPAKVVCTLHNLEKQPGIFTITYGFYVKGEPPIRLTDSINVNSMGSIDRSHIYNGTIAECICEGSPPQYQDCKLVIQYKTESRCHEVGENRTELQCHDVTENRTEQQCYNVTKYRKISVWKSIFG